MGNGNAGALVMPPNYVALNEEEMVYFEGGKSKSKTYSGAAGWAAVAALASVGGAMAGLGKKTITAAAPRIVAMTAGGPIGWVGAAITTVVGVAALGTLVYFGGQFLQASQQAAYYMAKKGKFRLSVNDNPVSLITVS